MRTVEQLPLHELSSLVRDLRACLQGHDPCTDELTRDQRERVDVLLRRAKIRTRAA